MAADRRAPDVWDGLAGAMATTVPLALGALGGRPDTGLMAGLGALNVALAIPTASRPAQLRWGGMALVATTLAAVTGVVVAEPPVLHVAATMIVVAAMTSLRRLGPRGAVLGFVTSAVLVIVSGIPDPGTAASTGAAFVAGGLLALGAFVAVSRAGREPATGPRAEDAAAGTMVVAHGLRVALAVGVATILAEAASLEFGYWVPLTTLAVLQPDHHASVVRAAQRCAGTVVGVALVAAVTLFTTDPAALIPLVAVCSFVLFALRERSYYWMVVALTPTALLMISTVVPEGWAIAGQRLEDTLVGVTIALVATGATFATQRAVASARRAGPPKRWPSEGPEAG